MAHWPWRLLETSCLAGAALVAVITGLGRAAAEFNGVGVWANLLPFATAVLGLALGVAAILRGWLVLRARLVKLRAWLPAAAGILLAAGCAWFTRQPLFDSSADNLRSLLGGRQEAERRAIVHQVFAAYRRTPVESWKKLLERAAPFETEMRQAAAAFDIDPEVLVGVAAAESGFLPRQSDDGGHGLFQITNVPLEATEAARAALGVKALDLRQHQHNAHVAAATLHLYLAEMNGDLFLGLLAYNIGPRNGGLRAIMRQYGAHDFVTIQPYLQNLPRDYPVRVLAAALAYRLRQREGQLPRYEDGDNARRIQQIGVPGLAG